MTPQTDDGDEPQSVMALTDREWTDLAAICSLYRSATQRYERREPGAKDDVELERKRALCTRIIEAAKW